MSSSALDTSGELHRARREDVNRTIQEYAVSLRRADQTSAPSYLTTKPPHRAPSALGHLRFSYQPAIASCGSQSSPSMRAGTSLRVRTTSATTYVRAAHTKKGQNDTTAAKFEKPSLKNSSRASRNAIFSITAEMPNATPSRPSARQRPSRTRARFQTEL